MRWEIQHVCGRLHACSRPTFSPARCSLACSPTYGEQLWRRLPTGYGAGAHSTLGSTGSSLWYTSKNISLPYPLLPPLIQAAQHCAIASLSCTL